MKPSSFAFPAVLAAVLALTSCFSAAPGDDGQGSSSSSFVSSAALSSSSSAQSLAGNDRISVTSPAPDALVRSPLTVTGQARGTWYFEASFPVRLLDAAGTVIAQTAAQAQGDWMTTDFVPFAATVTFAQPSTATGFLELQKDNPSGDPATAESIRIPVRF